jgi:ring-1,2-phenylacetyl-CoA epoxidase subunit PaaC
MPEQSNSALIDFTLHLADDALILGHRNSEWCGHGPVLEQDIAITNISLDLIGQARNFYQYAADLINSGSVPASFAPGPGIATEDSLAYLRDAGAFRNCLLVEQPKGDWATTILRQCFFSAFQYHLYVALQKSTDKRLAAIAEKSLKEVSYHLRWSSEWVVRLGDGTEESRRRILTALDSLWPFTGEFFVATSYENGNGHAVVDPANLQADWQQTLRPVFDEANLPWPSAQLMQAGGKEGRHTEHLIEILEDLQVLQRTYPGNEW